MKTTFSTVLSTAILLLVPLASVHGQYNSTGSLGTWNFIFNVWGDSRVIANPRGLCYDANQLACKSFSLNLASDGTVTGTTNFSSNPIAGKWLQTGFTQFTITLGTIVDANKYTWDFNSNKKCSVNALTNGNLVVDYSADYKVISVAPTWSLTKGNTCYHSSAYLGPNIPITTAPLTATQQTMLANNWSIGGEPDHDVLSYRQVTTLQAWRLFVQ